MSYKEAIKTCVFKKYATFNGTAKRSEYWWFWITYWFVLLGLPMLAFLLDSMGLKLYSLMAVWAIGSIGLFCPFVAVSLRRLHDGGHSGWNFLWRFIPIIGWIITTFLMLGPSKQAQSRMDDVIPTPEVEDAPLAAIDERTDVTLNHSQFLPKKEEAKENNAEERIADIEEKPSLYANNITTEAKICYCKHCGKKVENTDALFCKYCGKPL
jgi:uncharacterized membrane protein YhaH (DUF805 family)